ncbi:glutaredoxin family protein [Streptomonospora nanhaiensis]|uniref:Glutaredoxin n=1 Tax=Streptomonospora nanhaiensis TaxID=1323731 RepID=A0A853BNL2_9ACTN|nr:glutaredoxin family protein [Streptomonospora nanhaiensis]MBV2365964.1 glutaredoxin family protein [Streptomonospora nanhaiensis]MBX9388858.1 glutaredoxin family protein [Streptomonospora nanhaiensis]NYI96600.1 glutaredoxin [Streptomonospora nanhaiensis]
MFGRRRRGEAPAAGRTVTMLGKEGCHLCAEALAVIERVTAEVGAAYEVRDLADATQEERDDYWDKVPVVFVDGEQHDFWRVDADRLRAALTGRVRR